MHAYTHVARDVAINVANYKETVFPASVRTSLSANTNFNNPSRKMFEEEVQEIPSKGNNSLFRFEGFLSELEICRKESLYCRRIR